MSSDISLELGGQSYELRPDFACLAALEEFFGRPLLAIADIFIGGEAPLKLIVETLAIILGLAPGAQTALGDDIVAAGIGEVLERLQQFFLAAFGIEATAEKE